MLSSLGNKLAEMKEKARVIPVSLDLGYLPGEGTEQEFIVFGDKRAFQKAYTLSDVPDAVSALDFRRFYLVGIHLGTCPTGGYRIEVEQVARSTGKVEITVEFHEPKPDEMVTLAMTTPSMFFLVPRLKEKEPPVFVFKSTGGIPLAERKPEFGK